jgi:hypothetical protein
MSKRDWFPTAWNIPRSDNKKLQFRVIQEELDNFNQRDVWLLVPMLGFDEFGDVTSKWVAGIHVEHLIFNAFGSAVPKDGYHAIFSSSGELILTSLMTEDVTKAYLPEAQREADLGTKFGEGLDGKPALYYVCNPGDSAVKKSANWRIGTFMRQGAITRATSPLDDTVLPGWALMVMLGTLVFSLILRRNHS